MEMRVNKILILFSTEGWGKYIQQANVIFRLHKIKQSALTTPFFFSTNMRLQSSHNSSSSVDSKGLACCTIAQGVSENKMYICTHVEGCFPLVLLHPGLNCLKYLDLDPDFSFQSMVLSTFQPVNLSVRKVDTLYKEIVILANYLLKIFFFGIQFYKQNILMTS